MNSFNNDLISVIVPVYGVELYLKKCLDSIICQSYKRLDIILVDDGSPDKSGEICEEYAKNDSRIRVVHKTNGGLSDARNYGVKIAKGKYVTFVDSDDYIECDYVEYLYRLIKSGPYKMSIVSIFNDYNNSSVIVDRGGGVAFEISGEKAIEMMCYHDLIDTCAYSKMFDIDIMKDFYFPKGKVYEDIGSIYLLFDKCSLIKCGLNSKYHYVIRENSITTSNFNRSKLDLLEMTDNMARYVNAKHPNLRRATLRRQVYARFSTLNQMLDVKDKDNVYIKNSLIKYIKENGASVFKDKKTPFRDKVAIILLIINFNVYKFIWKIYLSLHHKNIV